MHGTELLGSVRTGPAQRQAA